MDKYCFTCFPFCSGVKYQHDSKFFSKAKWKSWRWSWIPSYLCKKQISKYSKEKQQQHRNVSEHYTKTPQWPKKKVKGNPTKYQLRTTFRESWTSLNTKILYYYKFIKQKHNLSFLLLHFPWVFFYNPLLYFFASLQQLCVKLQVCVLYIFTLYYYTT